MQSIKKGILFLTFAVFLTAGFALNISGETASVREDSTYLGRTYNTEFDRMFDDFERSTIQGIDGTTLDSATANGTDSIITDYHLSVPYDSASMTTADEAIYKVGSNANSTGTFNYLVFELRGREGATINDLMLTFRYDDQHSLIDVPFTDLLDPDYQPLPELTDTYQTYVIDVAGSLSGEQYVHNTTGDTIDAGTAFQGIHLHQDSTSTGSGVLDLDMVYLSNEVNPDYADTTSYSLLDNFERDEVSEGGDNVYWRDSVGQIIGKHLALNGMTAQASYESTGAANEDLAYDNVVFNLRGESGGEDLNITPLYDDNGTTVEGTTTLLSAVQGPDAQTLPAVGTDFTGFVVNFDNTSWAKDVIGFKLETIGTESDMIYVDSVFFTNMEYTPEVVVDTYPTLNPNELLKFDDFERDTLGATAVYDANNSTALDRGFDYIISYAGIDYQSVTNGDLVFDAEAADTHMQYSVKSNARVNDDAYDYVVFKVKGENGASLNDFRFNTIATDDSTSPVVWGHSELYSAQGLQTPQFGDDYPHMSGDYMHLIVDITETGLTENIAGFNLYYSGSGQLHIDDIYFANSQEPQLDMENRMVFEDFERTEVSPDPANYDNFWFDAGNASIVDGALKLDATGGQHTYYRTAAYPNNVDNPLPYLHLRMKGATDTTLDSFRMNIIPEEVDRYYNAGELVDPDGNVLPALTTEYQDYIIDLEKSNLLVAAEGYSLNFGSWDSGELFIEETGFVGNVQTISDVETNLSNVDIYDPVTEIALIDVNNNISDIDVDYGTSETDVTAALPSTTTIEDDAGDTYDVDLTWTIDNYDGNVSTSYIATGSFSLPDGVEQTDPETPLEVTATINVLEDPNANPELDSVDVNDDVSDIEVDHGTSEEDATANLADTITIEDTDGETHEVTLTWTIENYDSQTPGDYTATATFTLPDGVDSNSNIDESLTATITVLEDSGMSTGAIAGIITGAVALISGFIVYAVFFKK